jgi:hypothetical protein
MWGPFSLLFNGFRGAFPVVKRLVYAVDHSSTPSAEVKKKWSYTFTPHIYFHAVEKENIAFMCLLITHPQSLFPNMHGKIVR